MITPKDHHNMGHAEHEAAASKDPSTKVGAYIVDIDNRPVSLGRNGLPYGVSDDPDRLSNRAFKLAATLHAEHNAILFAERDRLPGSTIYVTAPPCAHCAAQIVQVGISRVVFLEASPEFLERWAESLQVAGGLFTEGRVVVEVMGHE